jgi:hypothetical protein
VVEVSDGRPGADGTPTDIAPLVESFIGVDLAETTAALHALQVLVPDTEVVSAIRAELGRRRQPMPLWLKGIGDTRVSGAAMMGTGPGDNILLGIDWDGGGSTTYVVYVDHTRGTVVRDAFPVPLTLDAAIAQFEEIAPAPVTPSSSRPSTSRTRGPSSRRHSATVTTASTPSRTPGPRAGPSSPGSSRRCPRTSNWP